MTAEHQRLRVNAAAKIPLEQWGPYLPERQWGTVREDYSENGDAWNYVPFSQSHFRTYRWGEDGIGGLCDYFQNLCFAVSLWNGKDEILKERLFGLGNKEGNHGEDVKELYYYLDNLPSHYFMKMLYKYPQRAFPYEKLREENRRLSKLDPEYELLDTGVFDDDRYFDVYISYAKISKKDIAIRIEVVNRGPQAAPLTVLPTLWFFNRWQRGGEHMNKKPSISYLNDHTVKTQHERLGTYYCYFQKPSRILFTENETNFEKLNGGVNEHIFTKDAFHEAIINHKHVSELQERRRGTKCAPVYHLKVPAGGSKTLYLRLSQAQLDEPFGNGFEKIFDKRQEEADHFYASILPPDVSEDRKLIQRRALAGLLWSKQFYYYDVERWIAIGDGIAHNNHVRRKGRNHEWMHLKNQDIILMPDKWEYPWYAAWDLAFHCIAYAQVDPVFAKHQLLLMMREWYMKPDGQLPAYEWNFSDVNPPVQAFAAIEIYRAEKERTGKGDIDFLKKAFHKLNINFTWWINRKDRNGNNMFEGGFLGLDNIGVFNRSIQLHSQMELDQADGTSWMGMYALNLMDMAIEISLHDPAYEDLATRFFEHFVLIAEALNELHLWNEEDKFFYDTLCPADGPPIQLRIQSVVGLTSLFAISIMEKNVFKALPDFNKRVKWFENYRKKNGKFLPNEEHAQDDTLLMSLVPKDKLVALLQRMLNEAEFLSPGGIRALSKHHEKHPYNVNIEGTNYNIQYDPGDSTSDFFGGNSNWRGPVWLPINYLLIQSIKELGSFYGDSLQLEYPSGSGIMMNLAEIGDALSARVISLFEKDDTGHRRYNEAYKWFYTRPENQDLLLYFEYFHGDSGKGLGASHQTGWTALVANLVSQLRRQDAGVD